MTRSPIPVPQRNTWIPPQPVTRPWPDRVCVYVRHGVRSAGATLMATSAAADESKGIAHQRTSSY